MKKNLFLFTMILTFEIQSLFAMEQKYKDPIISLLEVLQIAADHWQSQSELKTETDSNCYSVSWKQGSAHCRMEDTFDLKIIHDTNFAYFGIFDGHGGNKVSEYLKANLLNNIRKEKSITKGFEKTDSEISKNNQIAQQGSTAITAFIKNKTLSIANVGNSRALISQNGKAIAISEDQNTKNQNEIKRIKKAGGFFWNQRVCGYLIPTRSFGDFLEIPAEYKKTISVKALIQPIPEIIKLELSDEYEYLILASDGLWDVVENQEAIELIKSYKTLQEVSEHLINLAISKGSEDDITVIVVDLKKLMEQFK